MNEREEMHARRQALRNAYGELYDRVLAILFEHDPMGINFETNVDEYEPEVDTILPRLTACRNPADAQKVIHEEFERWFGVESVGDESRYGVVATEIFQAYKDFGSR